ncbi:CCA tRNA nucleotidyltransferase [Vagococcus sp. CY52-2]|uniref:CCA tRNA nucleotidyltransferase n=1 Tax=Vagococcus sp. CY52-2 TaxID=2925838 RepID=UPI001F56C2BE|nr:CCA tRNA nucleotidyltransferase [Vagococcus sp. CY52-2]UNM90272.1 CCA tRNA nucleotidyltransferase [Vagococcus sp. CY52-2]
MKINELPIEFKHALPVLKELNRHGYEAYFVGGSVRDVILHQTIHDVDIATSAFPEEIKEIFPRTIDVGIEHGTVLVLYHQDQYEITTFRTESTYQDYRRPDKVTFVRTLEEDLKRRDFTMNALAMTLDGEIVDLFEGIESIHEKEIKAVGNPDERFSEDALRMMRALRFASQLDFNIEVKTEEAIAKNHLLLEKIAIERIYIEWVKLLMGSHRKKGLRPFVETNCYKCCPELSNKKDELMSFSDVTPTMLLTSEELAWSCLLIALKETKIKSFFTKWKASKHLSNVVSQVVTYYNHRLEKDWDAQSLYDAGVEVISLVEQARAFFSLSNDETLYLETYDQLPIKSMTDLSISGRDILSFTNKKPGPWLGNVLSFSEKQVLNGHWENDKATLLKNINEMVVD